MTEETAVGSGAEGLSIIMKKLLIMVVAMAITCEPKWVFAQDKDVRALASDFSDALIKSGKKSAAVVDFTDLNGCVTELGRYLAERLSVSMASSGRGVEVVDRNHIKVLLQEHKLNSSGIIDPATAQKLGQIAGVQVLVAGTLTPFGDSIEVAVKALDSATANIITASTANVAKTKAIEELLGRGVVGGCPSMPAETGGGTGDLAQTPAVATVLEKFSFEPVSCRFPTADLNKATREGQLQSLACTLRVTNLAEVARNEGSGRQCSARRPPA